MGISFSCLLGTFSLFRSFEKSRPTHGLYAFGGFKLHSSSSANVSETEVKTKTHFTGFLGYQYFWENQWAVCAKIGVFTAESGVHLTSMKTSSLTIVPILFGFAYYPSKLSIGPVGRMHIGINGGMYMASGTRTDLSGAQFASSSINETVLGLEPNVGIDFLISRWLAIGPLFSYHWISQFKEVRESPRDYSGSVWGCNIVLLL